MNACEFQLSTPLTEDFKSIIQYFKSNVEKKSNVLSNLLEVVCDRLLPTLSSVENNGLLEEIKSIEKQNSLQGIDVAMIKVWYSTLCSFVAEIARSNVSTEQIMAIFEHLGLEGDVQKSCLRVLDEKLGNIRYYLTCSGFDWPNLIDLSWRLDFYLRSSTNGSVREPFFYVTLVSKTSELSSVIKKTTITCTPEQMQDLLFTFQEATNQIEKLKLV